MEYEKDYWFPKLNYKGYSRKRSIDKMFDFEYTISDDQLYNLALFLDYIKKEVTCIN